MSQPQIICVLGMHRTGTSCLTGSLQAAGLHLGKHSTWNKYNLRGNRENRDFVNFHEDLLAANKASWDNPPRKLRYSTSDLEQARELVAGFGDKRWGFKDPGTGRLEPGDPQRAIRWHFPPPTGGARFPATTRREHHEKDLPATLASLQPTAVLRIPSSPFSIALF